MINIPKYKNLLKVYLITLLALLLAGLALLSLAPTPARAQSGSTGSDGSLVVTQTVYIDTDRYTITQSLAAGSVTLPFSTGLNIVAGDEILIITMQGPTATVVGTYETAIVQTVGSNVLTLTTPLANSYDGTLFKVMAQRGPSYTSVIVENGGALVPHAWDGTTGGVIFFRAQTVTVKSGGKISATGLGYRGGVTSVGLGDGYQGESVRGLGAIGGYSGGNNQPNDGGGGVHVNGAGGNYGGSATNSDFYNSGGPAGAGMAGNTYGNSELRDLYLGSGGGGGHNNGGGTLGGNGGGIIYIEAGQLTVQGNIETNGASAVSGGGHFGAGGGSGGSIHLIVGEASLGDNQITASGGLRHCGSQFQTPCGGNGGVGRIRLDYNFLSGSTNPAHYQGPAPSGADLHLTLSGSPGAPLGRTISYTLMVQNNSLITAPSIVVTQTLPSSVTFFNASIAPSQTSPLMWDLGNLPSLQSQSLVITGTVSPSATLGSLLVATATATSDLAEANLTNNTASFTSTVVPGPATRLDLTVVDEVDLLMPFTATVTAYDAYNNRATGYDSTVTLTSTDVASSFPVSHPFTTTDQGVYTFTNLVLKTAGTQIITASDGALTDTATIAVDDDVVVDESISWSEASITLKSLVVTGTGTVLILEGGAEITTATVITVTENITIGSGAKISADGQGYVGSSGPGNGGNAGYDGGGGGGSYGGYGGTGRGIGGAGGTVSYGSVYQPNELGSGGGHGRRQGDLCSATGANGGGAIKLVVSNTLVNNGVLSANGANGASGCLFGVGGGGGGSGGSIWLDVDKLTGTGAIQANGGAGGSGSYDTDGGGGGGGHIAVYYITNQGFVFDAGHIQAIGGDGHSAQAGGSGTIYLNYIDPLTSTVEISPTSIPANGIAAGTIIVTLRTLTGTLIAGQPVSVTLKSGSQTNTYIKGQPASVGTINLGLTNANGVATASITSTTSEMKTVEAASGVVNLVNPGVVFFDTDFVNAAASTVSIQGPSTVAANGSATIEIRVTTRDKFGNLVPNVTTTLGTTPAVTITQVNAVTNQAGQAIYRISHNQPAHAVISATVNSLPLSQTVTATFEGINLNVSVIAPPLVAAGYPITYNLTVRNNGFLTATNVVVTDTLPNGVIFNTSSYTYTPSGNQIVWELGNLGPGISPISFNLVGNVTLTAPTALVNQVIVAANEVELNLSDNNSVLTTPVIPPTPILAVSPTYPTLPVIQGQIGSLVITVRNDGTGTMTHTTVVLPSTLPDWATVNPTNLGAIAPGQVATFTITAHTTDVDRGHYRDVLIVQAANVADQYVLLDVNVQGATHRDLQLTLTNNAGAIVAGADVILTENIPVVTEGQTGYELYYRQGVTDQAGRLIFPDLETDKTYSFDLSAYNHNPEGGNVAVISEAGVQAWAETLTGLPQLTVSPGTLSFGLARGSLSQHELTLRNPGAVTLTNISVTNPAHTPWVYLSEPAAEAVIPPGGELTVWINAAPPLTETVNHHLDDIEITASNGTAATANLDITLNDGLTRTLCINVQTEVNNPLTDGLVRLVDQTGQLVVNQGFTETVQSTLVKSLDSTGQVCFPDLRPGHYLATVGRGEQKLGEQELEVAPGVGTQEETLTVDEPSIIVNWSVTPTTIEDVYTTVMTMTFVPEEKPTLTLSPRSISLCEAGGNGVVTETVRIYNFYPVTFTLPVLELEALGNVRATITTTTGSSFSVLPAGKTSLPLSDIPPGATVELALHASFDEDPGQCMDGDAGAILLKLSANYVHYTPNYAWYGGASITPTLIPLSQTTTLPLKLINSGYPTEANLNTPPPAMQNISLTQPQNLSWITITPTEIISLPVDEEVDLTLNVTPPQWLAHGIYYDEIWVRATNGISGLIGIKAEMSDTGLRIETQLVTALFANSGGTSQPQASTGDLSGLPAPGLAYSHLRPLTPNPRPPLIDLRAPGLAYPLPYIPPGQISGNPQVSFWSNLVVNQNRSVGEVVDVFGDVWTLQVLNCDCSTPGQPAKSRPTWSRIGNQLIAVKVGDPSPPGSGAAFAPEFKDNIVLLRVTQRYALEREAFNAQLELINGTAASVTDLEVDITITDEGGSPVLLRQPGEPVTPTQTITPNFPSNSLLPTSTLRANMPSAWQENGAANFIIIPEEPTQLGSLGEAGQNNDRKLASWTIIPDASGLTSPLGKNYYVYATIRYNGNKIITTTKELITVQPQPKVLLDYFIPRYVFANEPFDWLVIATNVGYGPANNFSMGEPQIELLKQSDSYPINFTVNGESTLNFAKLEPGKQVTSTWQITADHNGYFASIEAACQHQNYQGIELPPLIYCQPTLHLIENTPLDDASQWGKDNACTIGSWQAFDSDPVNTYSGNFTTSHLDVSIPTWGLPLAFERSYNSRDPEDSPLGWSWTHNYNVELIRETYIPAETVPLSNEPGSGGGSSGGGGSGPGPIDSSLTRIASAKIGKLYTPPGLTLFGQAQDIMTVRLPHGSRAYFEIRDNGNTFVPFPGVKAELVRHLDIYTLTLPQEHTVYVFNADQKLAYLEDKNGNRLTFTYSNDPLPSDKKLLYVTDPAGRSLSFNYDEDGHILSMTDPLSRTMSFGYTNGYLTSATDFRGQTTTYAYTPPSSNPTQPGQLTTLTDANGHVEVTNHYDDKRRVDWQRDADGRQTNFGYVIDQSTGAQTTTMTDPRGHVTVYDYNDQGQLVKQTDTYGFFEQYEYDANYNLTRLVDKKGRETLYDWNDCGCDYEVVTDPLGFTTSMTYDSQHQLTSIADERGFVTTMTYDSRSNPLMVADPLAGAIQYSYGSRGQLLSKTDENNQTTLYGYDLYGNTTVIIDALSKATRMTYDLAGRLLSTTDALSRVTAYSYDPGNNLLQAVDPLTGTTTLTYDNMGNRLTMTDALHTGPNGLNRTTSYAYDARNNLIEVQRSTLDVQRFAYDANRNLTTEINQNGQTTTYQYDGLNRILTTTNALTGTMSYTYDPVGNRLTEQDPNGNVTNYVYDANDRIEETIYPDPSTGLGQGSKMTAVYDQADNLLSLTDGENRTISYQYDALGRVTIMTDPITGTVIYSYDAVGNQTAVTDAAGRTTTYAYDALNRPFRVTDPLSGVTESAYDALGNVISVTNAKGQTATFAYDELNRVIQATDPLSGTSHYSYDALGNRLQEIDPLGRVTTSAYDTLNRLTTVTNPLSGTTTYHYDAVGNLTQIIDPESRISNLQYDALNRPIEATDPLAGTATYTYDANSNLLLETDQEGRTTHYTYDAFNQVVTVTDAEGGLATLTYDKVGNLTRATDAEGRVTQFSYDALDRRIAVRDPLSNTLQYTYDPVGNRLTETDQAGRTTRYFYDARDRLITIRDVLNHELTYSYDAVDNRIRMVDPEGNEAHYAYDALDRLIAVTDALSQSTTYTYDAVSNQLSVTDAKGRATTYQYDALDRLVSTTDPLSGTSVFTYSLVGNLTQIQNPKSQTQNFEYDALDRLVQVIDAFNQSTRYGYDRVGNQVSLTDANNRTTTLAYDDLNQLVQITNALSGTTHYSYDHVGNLIQSQNPKSQSVNYEYDGLDRLIKVTDPLNQVTEFRYDPVGNQTELIDPLLRSTQYRYDLLNRLTEVEDVAHNLTTYTYDKVGHPIRVIDAEGRSTTTAYDALYRPFEITNPLSGTTHFTYDEVGNVLQSQNPKSQSVNYEYDGLDRLLKTSDALSGTTTYTYDPLGNLTQISNPKSQISSFEYDSLNRLIRATNPLSGVVQYEYDPVGNLVRQVDPLGLAIFTTYDALDRPTEVQRSTFDVQRYTYDALGNLLSQTDANHHTTRFDYDALNRLLSVTDPLSQTTQFEYDAIGNNIALIDPLNRRTEFNYNELDRLEQVIDPLNRVTQFSYDNVGNQVSLVDAENVTTRYEYDALDRLMATTQNYVNSGSQNVETNVTTRFEYDALGNLTGITDSLNHATTFSYDVLNRLTSQTDPLLHQTTYDYDALGNLTQITDPKSQISDLQYDSLNRLTSLTRPDEAISFSYDALGNRLSMSDPTGTTTYEYDDLYRLSQVTQPAAVGGPPSVVGYTYDAKGNRTGLTYPDGSQVNYSYDPADRLVSVEDWTTGLTTYDYDAASQLTQMALPNGITSTYSYDPAGQLTLLQYQSPIPNLQSLTLASYAYTYDDAGNRIQAVETVLTQVFTPTAVFTATPLAGVAPLTVTFHSTSTYATDLTWNFGDGLTQTIMLTSPLLGGTEGGLTTTHVYSQPGLYTITLAAQNDQLSHIFTRTNYIAVILPGAFEEEHGQVVMEAENFGQRINGLIQNWLLKTGQSGYTGASYLQPLPDLDVTIRPATLPLVAGQGQASELSDSPRVEYPINFTTAGNYTLWVRGYAANAAGDSLHVGLTPEGQMVSLTGFGPGGWQWANIAANGQPATFVVATPGPYTLTLWMREDGLRVDRLLLSTDTTYIPSGDGPAESSRAGEGLQTFVTPVSSVQQALIMQGSRGREAEVQESNPLVHNSQFTIHHSQFAQSPFGQDPTLLFLAPLAVAAPLAHRHRRWRRRAWLILLILLAIAFLGVGMALAAEMTADGRPTTDVYSMDNEQWTIDHSPRTMPYAIPNLQSPISNSPITTTYTYDPLYRLTGATDNDGGAFGYTYDAAGNRLTYGINSTQVATYTYNAANWLTQTAVSGQSPALSLPNGSAVSYTYDTNGNLLNDGMFTYGYDSADRLANLTSLTDTMNFIYNGDGVRVAQIVDGLRTDYVQDVAAALPQVLTAQQGGTVSKYLRGLGLIGEQRGGTGPNAAPATWQYHLPDALGSVRQVTDLQGQLLLTQRFDPFGGLLQRSSVGGPRSAYGFAVEEQDPESDQLFLRARTYNPSTGRFLQSDPVMGSPADPRTLHHYAYAFNNPVNYTDPSGLMPPQSEQSSSGTGGRPGPVSYASNAPTQGGSVYAHLIGSRPPERSANGSGGQAWLMRSDPHARQQSQGQRPQPCGIIGLFLDIRNNGQTFMNFAQQQSNAFDKDPRAYIQNTRANLREMAKDMWHQAAHNFWQNMEENKQFTQRNWPQFRANPWGHTRGGISLALDLIPIVGEIKGFIEATVGYDLAGNKLSDVEKTLLLVGGLVGLFTVADEIFDAARLGSKFLGNGDEVADVLRASKGLDNVDEVVDVGRGLSHADEVAEVVADAERSVSHLDEIPVNQLDNMDEAADLARTHNQLGKLDEVGDATHTQSRLEQVQQYGRYPDSVGTEPELLRFVTKDDELVDEMLEEVLAAYGDSPRHYSDALARPAASLGDRRITTLGRFDDTTSAVIMHQRILDVGQPGWKVPYEWDVNYWWLKEVVDGGDIIYLRSPVTREGLLGRRGLDISVYVRELDMLHQAGYRRAGDFLIPPH